MPSKASTSKNQTKEPEGKLEMETKMKPMNQQKMQKQLRNALDDPQMKEKLMLVFESFPKLGENIDILENHMITVQKNQIEFEKYLQDIQERLKRIEEWQTKH